MENLPKDLNNYQNSFIFQCFYGPLNNMSSRKLYLVPLSNNLPAQRMLWLQPSWHSSSGPMRALQKRIFGSDCVDHPERVLKIFSCFVVLRFIYFTMVNPIHSIINLALLHHLFHLFRSQCCWLILSFQISKSKQNGTHTITKYYKSAPSFPPTPNHCFSWLMFGIFPNAYWKIQHQQPFL